jgi:hypothetical protein
MSHEWYSREALPDFIPQVQQANTDVIAGF